MTFVTFVWPPWLERERFQESPFNIIGTGEITEADLSSIRIHLKKTKEQKQKTEQSSSLVWVFVVIVVLAFLFIYSLYIPITALFLPFLWVTPSKKGKPHHGYQPILAHQVEVGLSTSPTEARQSSPFGKGIPQTSNMNHCHFHQPIFCFYFGDSSSL